MRSRKRSPPPTLTFKPGDEVEVTSDEDGLVGAWFSARVLRAAPRAASYTVLYDRLLDDADPSRPLQEAIPAADVRPRPPRFAASGSFSLFQPVDAFQNDAWWSGVVVGVGERGRYRVRFAVEVCEYGAEELRPHVDWDGREWVVPEPVPIPQVPEPQEVLSPVPVSEVPEPQEVLSLVPVSEVSEPQEVLSLVPVLEVPELQEVLSLVPVSEYMELSKGTKVEVCSDEEGFRGAWFSATIIESAGEKFLVEYEHLQSDDETKLLRETIDPLFIRPTPPATPANENFKLLEEVDVLYNDGWWVGVISKVLDGSKYAVYFKTSGDEMEVNHQELRLHHDWVDGMWQRASQALTVET